MMQFIREGSKKPLIGAIEGFALAGGLELAVKLGRKYRRNRDVEVLLIDKNPTHIWKPLLHEVATGSMNSYHDETSYRLIAKKYRFHFILHIFSILASSFTFWSAFSVPRRCLPCLSE